MLVVSLHGGGRTRAPSLTRGSSTAAWIRRCSRREGMTWEGSRWSRLLSAVYSLPPRWTSWWRSQLIRSLRGRFWNETIWLKSELINSITKNRETKECIHNTVEVQGQGGRRTARNCVLIFIINRPPSLLYLLELFHPQSASEVRTSCVWRSNGMKCLPINSSRCGSFNKQRDEYCWNVYFQKPAMDLGLLGGYSLFSWRKVSVLVVMSR